MKYFEILDKENCPKLRGVFHCFTGTLEQAQRAIDLGFCTRNRREWLLLKMEESISF